MVRIYYRRLAAKDYATLHKHAYLLLLDAMKDYGASEIEAYTLCKNENGKPYFKECPCHFSITHTNGIVVVALSENEVGIDCEKCETVISDRVARRFLNKSSATVQDWTAYESIGKLLGVGIPYQKEEITKSIYTRHMDVDGYVFCLATYSDENNIQITKNL